jgi:hypothetical protein
MADRSFLDWPFLDDAIASWPTLDAGAPPI